MNIRTNTADRMQAYVHAQKEAQDFDETYSVKEVSAFANGFLYAQLNAPSTDAASEAIERVRALHTLNEGQIVSRDSGGEMIGIEPYRLCSECSGAWPCSTIAALDGAPQPELVRTLFYAPTTRNGVYTGRPGGLSEQEWHQAAMADTGCSHNLPGRLFVVQCEWCPKAFAGNSKAEAMAMFRRHEAAMSEPLPVGGETDGE